MTTIVAIDRLDIVRAGEAIGRDATPAQGETMRLAHRPDGSVVAVVYASSIVELAPRRIDVALRTLLDRMRDLNDEERRVVIALASEVIDESVAAIEQSVIAIDTYLLQQEETNGDNYHYDV